MIYSESLKVKALAELELRRRNRENGNVVKNKPLSFREFIRLVNPKYQFYKHLDKLIDILERVNSGEIDRLMVFMPPRHGKSETLSRLFSAYYLYCHPENWVGLNSYADALATTLSRSARDNYIRAGGEVNPSAKGVHHWETDSGGGMWAAGVGGPITGKGFHLGIIDDPIKNSKDADSQIVRDGHREWYQSTFGTREEPGAAIVIMLTRWHTDDLAGWLLAQERDEDNEPEHWHILSFPAIKSEVEQVFPSTCTVERDDRETGEALCPERYPIEKLERKKKRLTGRFWTALYSQSPKPGEGSVFLKAWWEGQKNRYNPDDTAIKNRVIGRWIFFDTALKNKATSDPTAYCVVELMPDYRLNVRRMEQSQILGALVPNKIETVATQWNQDGKLRGIIVEDKASGITAIQTLQLSAPVWLRKILIPFEPKGDKEFRATQAAVWCERDCIQFPQPSESNAGWYTDFLDEENGQLWIFPNAEHDDLVDTFSMAVIYLEHFIKQGFEARLGR